MSGIVVEGKFYENTNLICRKCGHAVYTSPNPGYRYQCPECDEDLFVFETDENPMSLVTEECPECGSENTLEWSVVNKGYQAFCPTCGFPMMLCSECMCDTSFCDWNGSTVLCYRMVEGVWKNLADVSFHEDKEGKLVLEKDYRLMIGTREVASFPAGTDREEIWHWFDERHPNGVVYLMYGEEGKKGEDKTEETE